MHALSSKQSNQTKMEQIIQRTHSIYINDFYLKVSFDEFIFK